MSRPINFTDTTVTKKPYVEINGNEYEVQDGTYQGGTDLNANTFNTMQDELNVFSNLLNKNSIINISDYTTSLSGNYKGYKYQLKPNTIYTLTCNNNNVTMSGSWIYRVYNSDNTSICILQDGSITSQITKTTFTTTSDGYIYFAHLLFFKILFIHYASFFRFSLNKNGTIAKKMYCIVADKLVKMNSPMNSISTNVRNMA